MMIKRSSKKDFQSGFLLTNTGGTAQWGFIGGNISAQLDLVAALAGKENTIVPGTTLDYRRGDNTWAVLNTGVVPEVSGSLYFQEQRVRDSVLTGIVFTSTAAVVDTDSVLVAFGKLQAQLSGINGSVYQLKSEKNQPSGYVGLDSSSKINPIYLPSIAITDTFVVNSQAAMLALAVEVGDIAIRTDVLKTFILQGSDPTILGNWVELISPALTTETDPIFTASPAFGITGTNITNWNTAFGWGNHAIAGYLLASVAATTYALISHTHAAADIVSGVIATARLGSGTANSTTYLAGDQTWKTAFTQTVADGLYAPLSHTHAAADIVSGTIATARLGSGTANAAAYLAGDQTWKVAFTQAIANTLYSVIGHTHAASDIVSGTIATARLGSGTASAATYLAGDQTWKTTFTKTIANGLYAALSHTHAASDIVSGTIATARLGSGTASSATYLAGDQTYKTTFTQTIANGLYYPLSSNPAGYITTASLTAEAEAIEIDMEVGHSNNKYVSPRALHESHVACASAIFNFENF